MIGLLDVSINAYAHDKYWRLCKIPTTDFSKCILLRRLWSLAEFRNVLHCLECRAIIKIMIAKVISRSLVTNHHQEQRLPSTCTTTFLISILEALLKARTALFLLVFLQKNNTNKRNRSVIRPRRRAPDKKWYEGTSGISGSLTCVYTVVECAPICGFRHLDRSTNSISAIEERIAKHTWVS